jgi:RNA polymerase sigma-70 factor (ECF subfamily)
VTIGEVDIQPGEPEFMPVEVLSVDFGTFFEQHHAEMVRALTLALGDPDLGRDAAAEGFVRALQRWSTVSMLANPGGWVYRAGINWARWRKTRRERFGLQIDAEAGATTPTDEALVRALRQLSVDHRTVVVGRYYLDWSEEQLATALDIAPGTVKSRLSRALTHLSELMEHNDDRP